MEKHSDKALKTLVLMGTEPEEWRHAPVVWKKEKRMVLGRVLCPDCHGNQYVRHKKDGAVIPMPDYKKDYSAWEEYLRTARDEDRLSGHRPFYGNCKRCRCDNRRSRDYNSSTGYVTGMVEQEVMVGYVEWPEGVRFDSRFNSSDRCNLCGKPIKDPFGWVPVVGTGTDGRAHGMWVGRDCATRFMEAVKLVKKEGHLFDRGGAKKT